MKSAAQPDQNSNVRVTNLLAVTVIASLWLGHAMVGTNAETAAMRRLKPVDAEEHPSPMMTSFQQPHPFMQEIQHLLGLQNQRRYNAWAPNLPACFSAIPSASPSGGSVMVKMTAKMAATSQWKTVGTE